MITQKVKWGPDQLSTLRVVVSQNVEAVQIYSLNSSICLASILLNYS